MLGKWFYIIIVLVGLILLGGSRPKIALTIAGLIFLGAVVLNTDKYKELLNQ